MEPLPEPRYFPPPQFADSDGLLGIGGKLSTEWLLDAYGHGIFPWPVGGGLLAWWSPDPRAVFEFDEFYVSRRLARTCRSGQFRITCDEDFRGVMEGCATAQQRADKTWLTPAMRIAYERMFDDGHAHSVEVWRNQELVGGVYGVCMGGLFAGESMFYRVRDASKAALAHLAAHLRARGYVLFDIQQMTPHTRSLGARAIPRREYLQRLQAALSCQATFGETLEGGPVQANGRNPTTRTG